MGDMSPCKSDSEDMIAICGIGLRLPGGVNNESDFWQHLLQGRDARKLFPKERYNTAGFDDSLGWTAPIQTKHGYLLENDLAELDTSFFAMTRAEAERCDPQQRQLLEVVRECFEDAGEVNYRGQQIACYVGNSGEDWLRMGAYEPFHVGGYVMAGNSDLMIANRVSYEYDLKGARCVQSAMPKWREAASESLDAVSCARRVARLLWSPFMKQSMPSRRVMPGALLLQARCSIWILQPRPS
jgi:acyl transferase domain-containing protein